MDSLFTFIKKLSRQNSFRKRYGIIVKVFRKLTNCNYDVNVVLKTRFKLMQGLSDNSSEFGWKPKDFELIPIHEWLKSK
jgi:hypothetical protein